MNNNINDQVLRNVFNKYCKTIWVYLKDSQTMGENFDPYRNTGYTTSNQNPLPVKGIISTVQANSLIMRELGLSETGAIRILVKDQDISLIKLAQKITYNNVKYSTFNQALGNKVQIYPGDFGFSKVILFRRGD